MCKTGAKQHFKAYEHATLKDYHSFSRRISKGGAVRAKAEPASQHRSWKEDETENDAVAAFVRFESNADIDGKVEGRAAGTDDEDDKGEDEGDANKIDG